MLDWVGGGWIGYPLDCTTNRAPAVLTRQSLEAGKQIQHGSFSKLRPESNLKRSLDAFVSNLKRILNAVTPPPLPKGPPPKCRHQYGAANAA